MYNFIVSFTCLPFIIVDSGKMKCEFDYEGHRFCVCDTYNEGEKEKFKGMRLADEIWH